MDLKCKNPRWGVLFSYGFYPMASPWMALPPNTTFGPGEQPLSMGFLPLVWVVSLSMHLDSTPTCPSLSFF
jgi:hypothetical protein